MGFVVSVSDAPVERRGPEPAADHAALVHFGYIPCRLPGQPRQDVGRLPAEVTGGLLDGRGQRHQRDRSPLAAAELEVAGLRRSDGSHVRLRVKASSALPVSLTTARAVVVLPQRESRHSGRSDLQLRRSGRAGPNQNDSCDRPQLIFSQVYFNRGSHLPRGSTAHKPGDAAMSAAQNRRSCFVATGFAVLAVSQRDGAEFRRHSSGFRRRRQAGRGAHRCRR